MKKGCSRRASAFFHLLFDGEQSLRAHGLLGERVAFEQGFEAIKVESTLYLLFKPGADLGLVTVPNSFHE